MRDSGKAIEGAAHLNFDLRKCGVAMDVYPYPTRPPLITSASSSTLEEWTHQTNIDKIHQAGITNGCNPADNIGSCPTRIADPGLRWRHS